MTTGKVLLQYIICQVQSFHILIITTATGLGLCLPMPLFDTKISKLFIDINIDTNFIYVQTYVYIHMQYSH